MIVVFYPRWEQSPDELYNEVIGIHDDSNMEEVGIDASITDANSEE